MGSSYVRCSERFSQSKPGRGIEPVTERGRGDDAYSCDTAVVAAAVVAVAAVAVAAERAVAASESELAATPICMAAMSGRAAEEP